MNRKALGAVTLLAAAIAGGLANLAGGAASAARWDADYFPNLPVVTHKGETLRFYDDLVKGKLVVINFIYTTCPDICSLSTARMAEVKDRLGDRVGKDIFFYSISLDPERDTPEVLEKYAQAFDSGPGWLFLTGDPDALHEIRWKLGERSRTLSEHRNDVVIGNDVTGSWRRSSLMSNLQLLALEILGMDPVWRAQIRKPTKQSAQNLSRRYELGTLPGEALYLKACKPCHALGEGDRVGPDLAGVTARRDRDWLVRFMIAPDQMRATKDPIAIALDAKFPGVSMPNLGLSTDDADDLILYLEAQIRLVEAAEHSGDPDHDHSTHDHSAHDHGAHDHSAQEHR